MGVEVVVCRTGYRRVGFQSLIPAADAVRVWEALLTAGGPLECCPVAWVLATPCAPRWATVARPGSGWRIGPVAARLWAGRSVGTSRSSAGGRPSCRVATRICSPGCVAWCCWNGECRARASSVHLGRLGLSLGTATSGTFSPTLKTGIALALLESGCPDGDEVVLNVRGRMARSGHAAAIRGGDGTGLTSRRPLSGAPRGLAENGPGDQDPGGGVPPPPEDIPSHDAEPSDGQLSDSQGRSPRRPAWPRPGRATDLLRRPPVR